MCIDRFKLFLARIYIISFKIEKLINVVSKGNVYFNFYLFIVRNIKKKKS